MTSNLLLIEDDEVFAQVLQNSLQKRGISCTHVSTIEQASDPELGKDFDSIVLDLYLDGESGLSILPQLRQRYPQASILVLTGYASIATTVQAMKLGTDNYLPKPANATQILNALTQESIELPESSQQKVVDQSEKSSDAGMQQDVLSVERLQWEHIQSVLAQHQGNISATARALGMHRRTLQRKLSKKPKNK
ncbi:response regulator transcription factor [Kangiella koreensis]|uniref:Two component transcriptional regulator, Fis family n=1 Tax=Kangiella koreensis (strain DSM 16069 / JCM 12317 / KCTC 12182 / SW-125) TaxID=523791 RepID=C7R8Q4_KANKD|nr:response regulator [Kangiella koreensis]ACV25917.1 two component transcriptional regulator, Fis family [Kangiella koreensis DSM 16069]